MIPDATVLDAIVDEMWSRLNESLIRGDIAGASKYLNNAAQWKFRPVFEALLPHVTDIVASYSPLYRISVSEDIGEYAVVRFHNEPKALYLIYFMKDADGVWRLDEM